VFISLIDVNDLPPTFTHWHYSATIIENAPPATLVTMVTAPIKATDPDSSSRLTYTFLGSTNNKEFVIDSQTGVVSSKMVLDRETVDTYSFLIRAADESGFHADTNLTITVLDANDNAPVFLNSSVNITVSESQALDKAFSDVDASDMDVGTNAETIYSLSRSSLVFSVDQHSGELRSGFVFVFFVPSSVCVLLPAQYEAPL